MDARLITGDQPPKNAGRRIVVLVLHRYIGFCAIRRRLAERCDSSLVGSERRVRVMARSPRCRSAKGRAKPRHIVFCRKGRIHYSFREFEAEPDSWANPVGRAAAHLPTVI